MSTKFKIVISDLHLGAGYAGRGNPLEDFDRDQAFSDFLAEIMAESETEHADVELILNGDIFEMLQVPHINRFEPGTIYHPQFYRSFTEANSVLKIDHIIAGHRSVFDALARFIYAGRPERKITFVKGNHDLDLYWPAVKNRIRQAIVGSDGGKRNILNFKECCYCDEGIYVEHGNQYEGLINRVTDMVNPLRNVSPPQIEVPPGSWFVINMLNQVEHDHYWIDGIKPVTALIWYSLAYDFRFAVSALATIVRGIPGMMDGILFARGTSEQELIRSWEDSERVELFAQQYQSDHSFQQQFNSLVNRLMSPLLEPQHSNRHAAQENLNARAMAAQAQQHLRTTLYHAALRIGHENNVPIVVFGHTHQAIEESSPEIGTTYFNSGTWTWYADFGKQGKDEWEYLFSHPERFTEHRKLSYVRIEYSRDGQPSGSLQEYRPPHYASLSDRIQRWFDASLPTPEASTCARKKHESL